MCKVTFRKTANERTGETVRYPIKYGRKNGKSIWVEYEVYGFMAQWGMLENKGAWIIIDDSVIEELASNKIEMDAKHQGKDNFVKYLEKNPEITQYLFKKFRNALTI